MARATYRQCKYCGQFHNVAEWPDNHRDPAPARSPLSIPAFISDTMEPGTHPYDGRTYESKSAWRRANRAGGYIEVGNDPARFRSKKRDVPDRKAITETLKKAKQQVFGV